MSHQEKVTKEGTKKPEAVKLGKGVLEQLNLIDAHLLDSLIMYIIALPPISSIYACRLMFTHLKADVGALDRGGALPEPAVS
ncbi:hypothetical protein AgCh_035379 [Apium graveolens]